MGLVSTDIKDMLVAESALGLTFATDLFIGKEPTTPDAVTTIYDTVGRPPQLTLNKEEFYEYPSIQVKVRHTDYRVGWNLADDIMRTLHGRAQETWNGSLYTVIQATNGVNALGWDKNNRVHFVVNFNIQRR